MSAPLPYSQQGYPPAEPYPPAQAYPPPAQAYPPAQPSAPAQATTTNTVIVQQPAVVQTTTVRFGEVPVSYNCHICHTQQVTRTSNEIGLLTWLIVGILCLFLLPFGLCPFALIPLCIPATMDVRHTCPNCNNHVGTYKRFN